jgi:hypothetical protein
MGKNFKRVTGVLAALVLSLVFLVPRLGWAQDSGFGLGIIVGDPNGLSLKAYIGPTVAIDGAVGLGLITGNHLAAHLDFLWEWRVTSWERANLAFYIGVGPKLGIFSDPDVLRVGARVPLGLTFQFTRVPLDLFFEAAPGLWFVDDVDFDLDAAVGLRFWF